MSPQPLTTGFTAYCGPCGAQSFEATSEDAHGWLARHAREKHGAEAQAFTREPVQPVEGEAQP